MVRLPRQCRGRDRTGSRSTPVSVRSGTGFFLFLYYLLVGRGTTVHHYERERMTRECPLVRVGPTHTHISQECCRDVGAFRRNMGRTSILVVPCLSSPLVGPGRVGYPCHDHNPTSGLEGSVGLRTTGNLPPGPRNRNAPILSPTTTRVTSPVSPREGDEFSLALKPLV